MLKIRLIQYKCIEKTVKELFYSILLRYFNRINKYMDFVLLFFLYFNADYLNISAK